jgi:hypothetical protein
MVHLFHHGPGDEDMHRHQSKGETNSDGDPASSGSGRNVREVRVRSELAVSLKVIHGVSSHLGKGIREGEITKSSVSIQSSQNTHSHHPHSSAISMGQMAKDGEFWKRNPGRSRTLQNVGFVKLNCKNGTEISLHGMEWAQATIFEYL